MTDTQYEYIKDNMPEWAKEVETTARLMVCDEYRSVLPQMSAYLVGMANSAQLLGMLSEAKDFTDYAVNKALEEKEAKEK